MEDRKPFTLIMKDELIIEAVRKGTITSSELASELGVHRVSMRGKLKAMMDEKKLIRRKIGQTYVYGVLEE